MAAASSFPELDRIVQKIVNGKSTFSDLVISALMYIQLQPRCPMYFSHLNEGPIFFWSYQAHSTGESHLSQSPQTPIINRGKLVLQNLKICWIYVRYRLGCCYISEVWEYTDKINAGFDPSRYTHRQYVCMC